MPTEPVSFDRKQVLGVGEVDPGDAPITEADLVLEDRLRESARTDRS